MPSVDFYLDGWSFTFQGHDLTIDATLRAKWLWHMDLDGAEELMVDPIVLHIHDEDSSPETRRASDCEWDIVREYVDAALDDPASKLYRIVADRIADEAMLAKDPLSGEANESCTY